MLLWKKGNVNITVSVLYNLVCFIMVHNSIRAVLTGRSTGSGFDLA